MKTHTQREKGKLRSLCLRHTWIHLAEQWSGAEWLSEDGSGTETDARVRRSLIHLPMLISYSPSAPRPYRQSSDLPNVKHNKQLTAHQAHHPTSPSPDKLIHVSPYSRHKRSEPTHTQTGAKKIRWALLFCRMKEFHLDNSFICKPWGPFSGYKRNSFLTRTIQTPCISCLCYGCCPRLPMWPQIPVLCEPLLSKSFLDGFTVPLKKHLFCL